MRVLILGMDGYLGWPLAQYLTAKGHEVAGVDLGLRREWVKEMGSQSATPIASMPERIKAFKEVSSKEIWYREGDLCDLAFTRSVLSETKPQAIVHLAEMPSAPYSMINVDRAVFTQSNNVIGNLNVLYAMNEICPDAHLVKLGTMGEYGTPNIDIPEGFFEVEFRGRKDYLPFPRQAHSWYHWSKVHDSNNIMFACKIWGLRSTDIMQGVVYGLHFPGMIDDARLITRFDFDHCFGTIINRFCAQAVSGHPLTVYGEGEQRRGFLPLQDSMQCLTLAIENPPHLGEYRVFNQFQKVYLLNNLAQLVQEAAKRQGISAEISHIANPRIEQQRHYFNPDHQKLFDLGYKPSDNIENELDQLLAYLKTHRSRIEAHKNAVMPNITWQAGQKEASSAHAREKVTA